MNVRELIVALGALDPTLPVVAEIVESGKSIPIDVVVVAGVIYEDENGRWICHEVAGWPPGYCNSISPQRKHDVTWSFTRPHACMKA